VKKNQVITYLFAMSVMMGAPVLADEKYPASDFQPEVVYQDKEYIAKSSTSSVGAATAFEVDSKYPAANFEPKIVYSDSSYKHTEPSSSSTAKTPETEAVSSSEATSVAQPVETPSQEKEDDGLSNMMLIVGLLAMAVGFVLFRGKFSVSSKTETKASSPDVAVASQKLTSVARYLNKVSGTGVSRYIEKQAKSSTTVTGVARYVAKKITTQKEQAPKTAVTGVEKYMRNRG